MSGTTIYLAGPDVFDPKHDTILAGRAEIVRRVGLEPLIPVDNRLTTPKEIFSFNVALLRSAGGVIANITPFRGPHCDVGTAWEIAYAFAHGKPVFAFSSDMRPLIERIEGARRTGLDPEGRTVEPFGLAENLMIAESVFERTVFPTFEAAAKAAARHFEQVGQRSPP